MTRIPPPPTKDAGGVNASTRMLLRRFSPRWRSTMSYILACKPTHYRLANGATACGRVGVAYATDDSRKVDCRNCLRTRQWTRARTRAAGGALYRWMNGFFSRVRERRTQATSGAHLRLVAAGTPETPPAAGLVAQGERR